VTVTPVSDIDIVTPTHNRSALLRRAIETVRAQSVTSWRLIVVSDACTDDTPDVVASFDDPRIRLIHSPQRHGKPGGPRNIGFLAATAPYVAYLDDDDCWEPDHLATLLEHFESGARWVATGSTYVDDAGNQRSVPGLYNKVWHPDLQLMSQMYEPSRTAHVREIVATAGGWANLNREDWHLWVRLADLGETLRISAKTTVRLRFSPTTQRHTAPSNWFRLEVGRVPTEEAARAVLDTVGSPDWQPRLAEAFYDEMRAWLAEMCDSDRMALPEGATRKDLLDEWDEMRRRAPAGTPLPLTGELQYHPDGDDVVVYGPVQAIDQTHADRIEKLVQRTAPRQLALVKEIIARCGGQAT
jgi:glycosyltransferase involved in cell wall biosynthesis